MSEPVAPAEPVVGIAGLGLYLPARFMTASEVAAASGLPVEVIEQKLGFRRKPVPGPDDHTIQMGVWAAQDCLKRAGADPADIDLVIWTGEEYKEYPLQTAGIKLQHEIGARRAWAFDVQLRCGTMVMALKLAKDLMTADPALKTVLLAGGYRNVDFIDYKNQRTRFMFNLAAGGGAILLKKGLARNTVLKSAAITDGSFADDVAVAAGGTRVPMTVEALRQGLYRLEVFDPEGMKERLDRLSMQNFVEVVRRAAETSGYKTADIDYLAILHMKRSAHAYVLRELGLPGEKSIYLEDYGHIGQIDQVLSLRLAEERGMLHDDGLVVLVSAGIGYAWTATAMRWGGQVAAG